jgi:diguanylate cyclase (GGDEF)-like protein
MELSLGAGSGRVMLDNATVRGALIALGKWAPTGHSGEMPIKVYDSWVASTETLIESLLLHEGICVPRLHSEEYPDTVATLRSLVGSEVVREVPMSDQDASALLSWATEDFGRWPLADKQLLERLNEFAGTKAPLTRWDRWFLKSYSGASAMYDWECSRREILDLVVDPSDITAQGGDSRQSPLAAWLNPSDASRVSLDSRDAAVLWLTYRTCMYDALSWVTAIPYVPHPQRAALWKAVNLRRSQPALFSNLPYDVLFDARMAVGKQVNETAGFELLDLEIPPFLTYVLAKSKKAADILSVTMDLRETPRIRALRAILREMASGLHSPGFVMRSQKLKSEFDRLSHFLTGEFLATPLPRISPAIQLVGAFSVQTDIEIPHQLFSGLARVALLRSPHLAVLRDVFKTTMDVWKLSHLYDKLFYGDRQLARHSYVPPDSDPDADFVAPQVCRRKLDDYLQVNRHRNAQLALMDIDGLDRLNARWGHKYADSAICIFGEEIKKSGARIVSRTGGDTFIAVFFGGNNRDWIDELRERVTNAVLVSAWGGHGEWDVYITIEFSIGVAAAPKDGSLADALMSVAYERLRQNKAERSNGRETTIWTIER